MSSSHRRAAYREKQAEKVLGVKRNRRHRYEPKADTTPLRHHSGEVLQPEVKTGGQVPKFIYKTLEQARGYLPGAIPLGVLSGFRGRAVAVLYLDDFAKLFGINPLPTKQLSIGAKP